MNKTPKLFILAGAVFGIPFFLFREHCLQQFLSKKSIYEENSQHLLSTYEQVDKNLFYVLSSTTGMRFSDWSNNLQYLDDTENMKNSLV